MSRARAAPPNEVPGTLKTVRALRRAIHRLRAGLDQNATALVLDSGTLKPVHVIDVAFMSDGSWLATAEDVPLDAERAASMRRLSVPDEWALRWLLLRLDRRKSTARIIRARPKFAGGSSTNAFALKPFVDEDRRREEDAFTYCQVRRIDGHWRVFTRTRIDFLPAERMLYGPATRASCLEWASGFDERAKAALEKDIAS